MFSMNVDLQNIMNVDRAQISFDTVCDLPNLPLKGGAKITGYAVNFAGQTEVHADVDCVLSTACSRCAEELAVPVHAEVHEVAGSEELPLTGTLLDLDDLAEKSILLQIEMVYLCRENCKGLCPRCGKNLNEGSCGCSEEETDERWAKLAALLKDGDLPKE